MEILKWEEPRWFDAVPEEVEREVYDFWTTQTSCPTGDKKDFACYYTRKASTQKMQSTYWERPRQKQHHPQHQSSGHAVKLNQSNTGRHFGDFHSVIQQNVGWNLFVCLGYRLRPIQFYLAIVLCCFCLRTIIPHCTAVNSSIVSDSHDLV